MTPEQQSILPITIIDWSSVGILFVGGALGTFARAAIGTAQKSITWRTGVEMLVGGIGGLFVDRLNLVGLIAPALVADEYTKLDVLGRALAIFALSYIGGHIFRSVEHRVQLRNENGNGNGNGNDNGRPRS